MLKTSSLAKWGAAVLLLSSLSSCEDILEQYFPKPTPPPTIPTFPPLGQDIAFYALSGGNKLDAYSTANAATRTSSVAITGLQSGETLLAIDFRPATGQLYGVSSASRLYVINQNTGVARAIGAGAFTPALGGNLVGFDFNPTVDRIRLVTATGQNLRLNPETGTVAATDGPVTGAAGATITGAAYTNNTAGASMTVLYDLDPATDQLYRQDPPNNGTLVPVGSLNLNITGNGGFDIDATTGTALGLYAVNGQPTLFTLDLATGAARPLAQYAANLSYTGLAIPTQPVAYSTRTAFETNAVSLTIFNPAAPSNPTVPSPFVTKPITGLSANEVITDIDFRPATGQLYALTSQASAPGLRRLYTLNTATAEATLVAPVSILLENNGGAAFDFNPVTDRIRLVNISTGQNLQVNPTTGEAIADTPITPAENLPFAVAYATNVAGATSTTLYGINSVRRGRQDFTATLYQLTTPSENTLMPVGILDQSFIISGRFDIGGTSNVGYVLLNQAFFTGITLYTIDLQTGRLTFKASYPTILGNTLALGLGF